MSATLLNYPLKDNSVADDIESFYHLLVLFFLRFHAHELGSSELKSTLALFYDQRSEIKGYCVGSSAKLLSMKNGALPCDVPSNAFGSLLRTLSRICRDHYASLDIQGLRKYRIFQHLPRRAQTQQTHENPTAKSQKSRLNLSKFLMMHEDIDPSNASVAPVDPPRASPKLNNHNAFLRAFIAAVKCSDWDLADKEPADAFDPIDSAPLSGYTKGTTSNETTCRFRSSTPEVDAPQDRSDDGLAEAMGRAPKRAKIRTRTSVTDQQPTETRSETARTLEGGSRDMGDVETRL